MNKNVLSFIFSALAAILVALPGFSQGINGSATSSNAGGTYANSGGASGNFSNTPGQLTTPQTANNTELNRTFNLSSAAYSLLAPGSVDTSPFPSGQFNYGFPNEASAPFMGVDHGSVGGTLPSTSTSSVNLNTVDCPFIRLPTEGNGVYGSAGGSGININVGNSFGVNLNGGGINFGGTIGGVSVGGTINTGNALNNVQTFFNGGGGDD